MRVNETQLEKPAAAGRAAKTGLECTRTLGGGG